MGFISYRWKNSRGGPLKHFLKIAVFAGSVLIVPSWATEEAKDSAKLPVSVLANDPEQGFKLSEVAIKRLGIQFTELKNSGPWELPPSALVRIKRAVGVYRESEGFLTFVVVESVGAKGLVRSVDLRAGDRVVVEGGAFLRVIDLDLSGAGGDSCGG